MVARFASTSPLPATTTAVDVAAGSAAAAVVDVAVSATVVAVEVNPTTGEKKLVTPPAHVGILKGTSQAALFKLAEQRGWVTEERVLRVEDLTAAAGVWLVSSVRVQARVTELDGIQLPRPEVADEVEKMAWEAVTG